MGVELTTPRAEINEYIARQVERMTKAIIYNLQYIGERCLNAARQTNSYKDQTGNLRSSLGYVIAMDGNLIYQSDFQVVRQGGEGVKTGARYAKEIVKQFPQGFALIVVAGMEYAACVAGKGYDVLDSAEVLAIKEVPRIMKMLKIPTD